MVLATGGARICVRCYLRCIHSSRDLRSVIVAGARDWSVADAAVLWTWWWSSARSDFVAGAVIRDFWTCGSFSEIWGSVERKLRFGILVLRVVLWKRSCCEALWQGCARADCADFVASAAALCGS